MPALGEVSEPVNRDSDVLLGNFCNVMVDVMPGSITYKLGFQDNLVLDFLSLD